MDAGVEWRAIESRLRAASRRKRRRASRERFVETAYWNPSVVTGKDGKARVTFKAPTALSAYRITARGVTGADTLAGQTTASLTVRKNFFVDLKSPELAHPGRQAAVHRAGPPHGRAREARPPAGHYAGGRDEVFPKTLELKQDGVDEVVFEPFEVPEGDSVRLTLTGTVGEVKDELVVEVPVRPWGVQVFASASGTGSDSTTVFVGLPAGRTYESPEMLITVSPTLERMLIELALGGVDLLGEPLVLDSWHALHCRRRPTRPPTAPPICWRRPRCSAICAMSAPPPRPKPSG